MELGEIQKAWIADLRKHPERQIRGELGYKCKEIIRCCALGQAIISYWETKNKEPYIRELLIKGMSYGNIGLSLSGIDHIIELNDLEGKSFSTIADYIEAHPEEIFNKSF